MNMGMSIATTMMGCFMDSISTWLGEALDVALCNHYIDVTGKEPDDSAKNITFFQVYEYDNDHVIVLLRDSVQEDTHVIIMHRTVFQGGFGMTTQHIGHLYSWDTNVDHNYLIQGMVRKYTDPKDN